MYQCETMLNVAALWSISDLWLSKCVLFFNRFELKSTNVWLNENSLKLTKYWVRNDSILPDVLHPIIINLFNFPEQSPKNVSCLQPALLSALHSAVLVMLFVVLQSTKTQQSRVLMAADERGRSALNFHLFTALKISATTLFAVFYVCTLFCPHHVSCSYLQLCDKVWTTFMVSASKTTVE